MRISSVAWSDDEQNFATMHINIGNKCFVIIEITEQQSVFVSCDWTVFRKGFGVMQRNELRSGIFAFPPFLIYFISDDCYS